MQYYTKKSDANFGQSLLPFEDLMTINMTWKVRFCGPWPKPHQKVAVARPSILGTSVTSRLATSLREQQRLGRSLILTIMAPKGKAGDKAKGKGKAPAEEKGAGKVKPTQQINVRHILVMILGPR
jgi:hypothetical protein